MKSSAIPIYYPIGGCAGEFINDRWSPTICCRSLFPWSNRVLLSLNFRKPCSVGGVAIWSSEKCSSWLFSHPASKYKKRRLKRTASASAVLCAFPFYKDFIHAHAPQPRDRVEVIYARKAPSRLPLVHALRAAQTEVFLQLLHAVPLLQPQAAEVSARSGSVNDGIARQLPSLHAASRAAPKAQQVGPGDELGFARVWDALHRGVQRLAAPPRG